MTMSEANRLESLWSGEFGDDYVDRNLDAYEHRGGFWEPLVRALQPASALEVGCNVGGNLQWIAPIVGPRRVYGIDVNRKAVEFLRERLPGVQAFEGSARSLPFPDASIDLVFTMGVLIHQPDESLPVVMGEMVRVANRYVLCGEYYDESTVEVSYRGHEGALFRRDYGGMFASRFSDRLRLVRREFLSRETGWDDVTVWLFEKRP
jgi:pseudaminic acid biosynthesis-associated methylase